MKDDGEPKLNIMGCDTAYCTEIPKENVASIANNYFFIYFGKNTGTYTALLHM
jgi:hypothetical protein